MLISLDCGIVMAKLGSKRLSGTGGWLATLLAEQYAKR